LFRRPPPSSLIAISVHPDRIDVAKVTRNGSAPPVVEICESRAKQGPDDDVLLALRKDLRLDRHHCGTLLGASEYQLQLLEAPNVPAQELKSAVRWKLKDVLDYPVEAATVDLVMVPSDPSAPTRGKSVYAVAARNSIVESHMKLFHAASVPLRVIDIPELAQRNLAALLETEGRGLALLSFGSEGGLLTFSTGGELYLSRRIEIGLDMLMNADAERRAQMFERIALELQRSLDHFDRQFSYVPLARLVVGPLPRELGLEVYLAGNLYVPVEAADMSTLLDLGRHEELRDPLQQQRYFYLLGAALRSEMPQ
jgi:MSHA biogenesis protein MshI